jgi:hypothetical protein
VGAKPLLTQCNRLGKRLVEGLIERGAGNGARQVGPRLPQVVVDGDRTLLEQQSGPRRRRRQALGDGITRVGGDRLAKGGQSLSVIEVVTKLQAERPQCPRGCGT